MPEMRFVPFHFEIFDAMKGLHVLIDDRKRSENKLSKIDEKASKDPKAKKYLNIIDQRMSLNNKLDENERSINKEICTILSNDVFKNELRSLPQRNLQLIDIQKELAEELSEEKITEEEFNRINTQINYEFDYLCSETVRRLYKQDIQDIYATGISASDISYISNLSQLDYEIHKEAEDRIADYYMETAEQHIEQNSLSASKKKTVQNIILNNDSLRCRVEGSEDERMTLVTLRYVIEQTLNGVSICISSMKAELKKNPSKELKAKLKKQAKELNAESEEIKLELKNNVPQLAKSRFFGEVLGLSPKSELEKQQSVVSGSRLNGKMRCQSS